MENNVINNPTKPTWQGFSAYLPSLFFISGFLFDIATLGRIDSLLNIFSHGLYLGLIVWIILLQIMDWQPTEQVGLTVFVFFTYMNEILHFLLGALLNAFVIFYFKSSSLINSLTLLMVLGLLLIANEMSFFRRQGPALKVGLLTISAISFFIYVVPILFGHTGPLIFAVSLAAALLFMTLCRYFLVLKKIPAARIRRELVYPAATVFCFFIALYFLKLIPPVPLSLKQIGIYHQVERNGENYVLRHENPAWRFWSSGDQNFIARPGDLIYLFTRVFSPGGFTDRVYIHFQYQDNKAGWKSSDRIQMSIVGGRDDGFRAYAYKKNYHAGIWRALVETADGLEIGRIGFTVTMIEEPDPDRRFIEDRR